MNQLVEVSDLTGFVGVAELNELDKARAEKAIWLADVLVRSEFGGEIEDRLSNDKVDSLKAVELLVAGRLFRNRSFASRETTGPFSVVVSDLLAEGWVLTDHERAMVARAKGKRFPGLATIGTTRLENDQRCGWVPTPDGNLFPMTPLSDR